MGISTAKSRPARLMYTTRVQQSLIYASSMLHPRAEKGLDTIKATVPMIKDANPMGLATRKSTTMTPESWSGGYFVGLASADAPNGIIKNDAIINMMANFLTPCIKASLCCDYFALLSRNPTHPTDF
jgi:hypothetical protein